MFAGITGGRPGCRVEPSAIIMEGRLTPLPRVVQGWHVMPLFFRVNRAVWFMLVGLALAGEPAWAEDAAVAARHLQLAGKYAEARDAYAELAEKQPVVAALGVARCQAAGGEIDEALRTLSKAAEHEPASAEVQAELASLYFERGDYAAVDR